MSTEPRYVVAIIPADMVTDGTLWAELPDAVDIHLRFADGTVTAVAMEVDTVDTGTDWRGDPYPIPLWRDVEGGAV